MNDIDQAALKFETLIQSFEQLKTVDLSETDTRSKIIDFLLIEVLGWNEKQIKREGHSQAGFYDYKISIPGFHFVVEAKKNFVELKLPVKHKTVTLNTLLKSNKDVITQIRNYLFEESLQYGVITNGHQFIIAKFINFDGNDWKKNRALVFSNLEDVKTRFIDLYNSISKYAIIENNGFLLETDLELKGKTIISTLPNKNAELIRNELSSNLMPIIDAVFGEIFKYEILDNEELIKECFVKNKEILKNKSDIETLFGDKPPALNEVSQVRNTENLISQIESDISNIPISSRLITPPKPIIIIGSRGAGKTTFINYLFNFAFSEEIKNSRPFVYIDFRKYTIYDLQQKKEEIIQKIIESLDEKYEHFDIYSIKVLKRIFIKDIHRKDKGTWKDDKINNPEEYKKKLHTFIDEEVKKTESFFIKISEYLIRERRLRLCVIIDNADQLDIEIQKEAFLFAQSLNIQSKCALIISLREGYYYKWRDRIPFNAFDSQVYHITAPKYSEILQKRMNYALNQLHIKGKTIGRADGFSGGEVELSNEVIKRFLMSVKETLFSSENHEMMDFLQKTTYPNLRAGLKLFKRFLLSGHTKVEEYVLRQHATPNSRISIPIWEFVKSVALDNKPYFNEETSTIKNLFIPVEGSTNHFIKIKILKYLLARRNRLQENDKFIPLEELEQLFIDAGYKKNIIRSEIIKLLSYAMIETDDIITDIKNTKIEEQLSSDNNVSISLKGYYYITELKNRFHYLDLIVQDTPIFSETHFEKIRSSFPLSNMEGKRSLPKKIETVKAFIQYLKEAEDKESVEIEDIAKGVMSEIMANGLRGDLHYMGKERDKEKKST
jgi:GTPase SAR1 family protein